MPPGKIRSSTIGAIRRVLRSAIAFCCLSGTFAFADSSTQLPAGITVELIAPEQVEAGESFTVYALVSNEGDEYLPFPLVERVGPGHHDIHSGYRYIPCGIHCVAASQVRPGQSVYVGAGTYYYADPVLAGGQLVIDDYQLRFLSREPLRMEGADLDQSLTVSISHSGDTDLYPPLAGPPRAALELHDLLTPGDGIRVHDPNTGSEWVRFEATMGMSTEEVIAALGPGGRFGDYSLARISQVEELLMNHVLASGLTVQLPDLYRTPAPALKTALARFIELMRPSMTRTEENSMFMEGAVADGITHSAPVDDVVGVLHIVARSDGHSSCTCQAPSMFGTSRSVWNWESPDHSLDGSSPPGLWLVKPSKPGPTRPADTASFHDDELVIPAVRIDGSDYRVRLRMIDRRHEVLRIASLKPITATMDAIPFDADSGRITIPEVVIIDENGATATLRLTLALIDHAGPSLIQVVQRQPLAMAP